VSVVTTVKFEITNQPIRLLERCFGCGCTRTVEVDPPWTHIPIKDDVPADLAARIMVGMAPEHEHEVGVTEMGFCNKCAPGIKKELKARGVTALHAMEVLNAGVRRTSRRKWSWLHRETKKKHKTIMQAARALRA
jgi:hypothetical protein